MLQLILLIDKNTICINLTYLYLQFLNSSNSCNSCICLKKDPICSNITSSLVQNIFMTVLCQNIFIDINSFSCNRKNKHLKHCTTIISKVSRCTTLVGRERHQLVKTILTDFFFYSQRIKSLYARMYTYKWQF